MSETVTRRPRRPVKAWVRGEGLTWAADVGGSVLQVTRAPSEQYGIEWVASVDGLEVGRDWESYWNAMFMAEDHARGGVL